MIFGIGTDILTAERVANTYKRFGERFISRLLMDEEQEQFAFTKQPERFLAMRFAAKEAIVKAMGTGFSNGMWIRDSGVLSNRLGKPEIIFSDRGKKLCKEFGIIGGHVTLSDEGGKVIAVAVLEK
ncbi:MAG: holo-ACP synthase [Pseudomonadota bacterium]|nr:holo-ACP synthase [Pseudomonadota bacterium]